MDHLDLSLSDHYLPDHNEIMAMPNCLVLKKYKYYDIEKVYFDSNSANHKLILFKCDLIMCSSRNLINYIQNSLFLKTIIFYKCKLGWIFSQKFSEALAVNPGIGALKFWNCNTKRFVIMRAICSASGLVVADVRQSQIHTNIKKGEYILPKGLLAFNLEDVRITQDVLQVLAQNLETHQHLAYLNLYDTTKEINLEKQDLIRHIISKNTSIQHFSLIMKSLYATNFINPLARNTSIRFLDLEYENLDRPQMDVLANVLQINKIIERLHLDVSVVNWDFLMALNRSSIQHLRISQRQFYQIFHDQVLQVCEFLQYNNSLANLELKIALPDIEMSNCLATSIMHNTALKVLKIYVIRYSSERSLENVRCIMPALAYNQTLEELSFRAFDNSRILNLPSLKIYESLKYNQSLRKLEIYGIYGVSVALDLEDALTHNQTLKHLGLGYVDSRVLKALVCTPFITTFEFGSENQHFSSDVINAHVETHLQENRLRISHLVPNLRLQAAKAYSNTHNYMPEPEIVPTEVTEYLMSARRLYIRSVIKSH